MSLTREEWKELWDDLKTMEAYWMGRPKNSATRSSMLIIIVRMKARIEQVIGQME